MSLTIPKSKQAQLTFLISSATQAPSSHNTQPWQFTIKDNTISIYADLTRQLKIGDPLDRELYTSIGASIENILTSAKALGIKTQLDLFPQKSAPDLVANVVLSFSSKKTTVNTKLLEAIWNRRTNRTMYKPTKAIPASILKIINKLTDDSGLKIHLITDRLQISKLGQLVESGMLKFLKKDSFRKELSGWIRHDWSKKGDGLPGYSLGMSGIISIMAPILIRSSAKIHEVAASEKAVVVSSPAIGIIAQPQDKKIWWVKTGMLFQSIALRLQMSGLSTAILTAAVESKPERLKLKQMIKGEPGLFFRLGYATGPGVGVPRRDVSHVSR